MSVTNQNKLAAVGRSLQTSSTRMFSPLVWQDCPYWELEKGLKDGYAYFDDLLGTYVQATNVAASATTLPSPWCAFSDATAGNTINQGVLTDTGVAGGAVGVMELNGTTTQEGIVVGLHTSLNTAAPIGALIATNRVWWECRLKISTITTQEIAFFAGLLPVAKIATPVSTVFATAGSVMAAIDHIGFMKIAAGTTAVKTVHGNGTATVLDATAGTIAADTYTKLGMYWNGAIATFYQDGAALTTTLALAATQFPAGANLAWHLAFMDGSGASTNLVSLDWVRIAFERTSTALLAEAVPVETESQSRLFHRSAKIEVAAEPP